MAERERTQELRGRSRPGRAATPQGHGVNSLGVVLSFVFVVVSCIIARLKKMALVAPGCNIAWELAGLNLCIQLEIVLSARQHVSYYSCLFVLSKLQRLSSNHHVLSCQRATGGCTTNAASLSRRLHHRLTKSHAHRLL